MSQQPLLSFLASAVAEIAWTVGGDGCETAGAEPRGRKATAEIQEKGRGEKRDSRE